ncbi:MAG: 30S ribosomal protein S15 [Candidatus Pacearchaeota archaeon]|nr:MAG: 30S ribosomal protein S15 [Candidatus Pacearchaeota archaeon]
MATLYGKGRGKAGSHAPKAEKPYWFSMKPEEVEKLIVDLAKKGTNPVKIGLILRDNYSVPSVKTVTGKKIKKILEEKGIEVEPYEIIALEKRVRELKRHLAKNKKDMRAKRGLQLSEAKIRRLKKYKKKEKKT